MQFLSASSAMRPAIDLYCINIDSFGQKFVPTIDLSRDDIGDVVRAAIGVEPRSRPKSWRWVVRWCSPGRPRQR